MNYKNSISNKIKQNLYFSKDFDLETLNELGFFVLKNAFKKKNLEKYIVKIKNLIKKKDIIKTNLHSVEYKIHEFNFFKKILDEKELKKIVKNFYGGNVGADFFRVIKKDALNTSKVFCHQDTGYQIGSFERYSLFIALTKNNYSNGGLILYPCTHKIGYLGDAGEISKNVTKKFVKIKTDLNIGDVLIMHSALWHESGVNKKKTDRIYFEIHIQSSEEPTTRYNILGKRKKSLNINLNFKKIFSNSRKQRIKNFQKQILNFKNKQN